MRRKALFLVGCLLASLWPCVGRGDEIVRQVQEELRKRSLYFGDIDGRSTPQLAAALRRYQERKGFAPTGQTDETTLQSLNLRQPPDMAAPASGGEMTAVTQTFLPWPDIVVLKSDQSRSADSPLPPENDAALLPRPSPAPPPAAAAVRRISPEDARRFVERYLQAGQTNDPAAELTFYGDKVDYFDEGVVDRQFIEKDVQRYNRRWPDRKFTLLDPVKVTAVNDASHTKVDFQYQFAVKGNEYMVRGKVGTTYILAGDQPDHLKIVSVKEQRVRR